MKDSYTNHRSTKRQCLVFLDMTYDVWMEGPSNWFPLN